MRLNLSNPFAVRTARDFLKFCWVPCKFSLSWGAFFDKHVVFGANWPVAEWRHAWGLLWKRISTQNTKKLTFAALAATSSPSAPLLVTTSISKSALYATHSSLASRRSLTLAVVLRPSRSASVCSALRSTPNNRILKPQAYPEAAWEWQLRQFGCVLYQSFKKRLVHCGLGAFCFSANQYLPHHNLSRHSSPQTDNKLASC